MNILKHLAFPAILIAIAVIVIGVFSALEQSKTAQEFATPQAAIAASFK